MAQWLRTWSLFSLLFQRTKVNFLTPMSNGSQPLLTPVPGDMISLASGHVYTCALPPPPNTNTHSLYLIKNKKYKTQNGKNTLEGKEA